jgi:hypothetical protein
MAAMADSGTSTPGRYPGDRPDSAAIWPEILAAWRKATKPDMGKDATSEAGFTIEAILA